MRVLLVILMLALTGCATHARVVDIAPTTAPVAVPVTCTPDLPPAMAYPDTDEALRATPSILRKAQLVMAGRLMRIQREIELNIALAGCAGRVSK